MTHKIDTRDLDVIVIGAGPAGGSCARECAKRGLKVLLMERSLEIGEPNYSTAGTPKETIEDFGLPPSLLASEWDSIVFATPRVSARWKYTQTMGFVLDFAGLKKFLVEDAILHGAEVLIGTTVKSFIEERGKFAGVNYHGALGSGEARAKVVIDATGHHELGNVQLKINSPSPECYGVAMEYQMAGLPRALHNTLAFYFGSRYAPHGYAWIFTMNNNKDAKVGVCAAQSYHTDKSLKDIQSGFLDALPEYFQNLEPTELHAGAAHADGGVKTHVYKNLILIGDAARQINPLFGEGIRHALNAGRMAAGVIFDSLQGEGQDMLRLKMKYERLWQATYAHSWKRSLLMCNLIYKTLDDDGLDDLLVHLQQISPDDWYKIITKYEYKLFFKYPRIPLFFAKYSKDIAKLYLQGAVS